METDQNAKEEEKMQWTRKEPHIEEQQQQTPAKKIGWSLKKWEPLKLDQKTKKKMDQPPQTQEGKSEEQYCGPAN